MNSRQIECVLEVAKTMNFNRAAENLYISQPTLSHHVKTLEEELRFKIFERAGKSISLTEVGKRFCLGLTEINHDMQRLIEQCQNFGNKYQASIRISVFTRTALLKLPEAIQIFKKKYPSVFIEPVFDATPARLDHFLDHQSDIIFIHDEEAQNIRKVINYPIYDSQIKLVTSKDDPLAKKEVVTAENFKDRTLLVGGGSGPTLRALQKDLMKKYDFDTLNSPNHSTTLTQVAAGVAVCLSPDLYEDYDPTIAWTQFEPHTSIPCYLIIHENANGEVRSFVKILRDLYRK